MTTVKLHVESTIGPTTDVGAMWKAAVDRYEDTTKFKIQSLAGAISVDEILGQIHERETKFTTHRHDGSKLDKFRTLVRNSLVPIAMLGDIVAKATKTLYPPTEAIFAAVRYLISTANAVSADYDKIAGFFEDLDSYLSRLKILEHKIPPIAELKEALTEVFTSVLVLCGIWAKYVKMKRIVKAFRSLVSGEDDELKTAYDHFHKAVDREQGVVRNAILVGVEHLKQDTSDVHTDVRANLAVTECIDRNTKNVVAGTGRIHKYFESQETTLERKNILSWLSSLDFHEKQRTTFAKHHEGTGEWLLNTDQFQQWFNGNQNSTLWCPGIPGAGKTVMTSLAISYIEANTQGLKVAIAYLYCDYKDPKTQSELELLSSITRQLAEQSNPMPPEIKAFCEKYTEKRSYPSDDERISLVRAMSVLFERIYVFLDALDECPEANRQKFLHLAKKLEPFVRLFITSRPHLDLQAKFPNITRIDIVARDSDIQTYLEFIISTNNRMSLFTAKDPTLEENIVRSVNEKAAGMFLLAHLQIGYLCGQSSSGKVRKSLDAMSIGVYAFYEDAMGRIEDQSEDDRDLAKRALSYIFYARRPLNVEELRHALGVEAGDAELDKTSLPETEILFNISAGLIRVDEKSSTTGLVHHTLQEYLERNPEKLLPGSEVEIAKICLTYLSFDVFESGPCKDGQALEQRLHEYRFLDYASHNWGSHIVEDQFYERTDLLSKFLADEEKVSSFVQVLHIPRYRVKGWYDRFPKQFSQLHVVAYWGLDKILTVICKEGRDINSQDSYGATALQLAAQYGHTAVVRLLIENGAKVDISNRRGETALSWAARNSHKTTVELLLVNGANVMMEDNEGWTALDWAIIGGYKTVAEVLLDHYVDIDSKNDGLNKALILASEAGNEMTVQMLLDDGAEINWKDDAGSTALTWAVPGGHENTVRVLLKNEADVNSRDMFDNTPLHWAIPHKTIARLLLEKGADINAKNNCGQTALFWSAQDRQAEVLRLLLQNNADVNVQDHYGFTALHATALNGHEAMARLLLEHGASPNEKDKDGWTPLHAAALKQHKALVHLLLDKVENGRQILEWVASQQKDTRMRALLEQMAEKKSAGSTVVTGLRSAANEGHVERVQALLDNGADIDAEDVGGSTALTLATWLGQENIVKLLLENGADVDRCERTGRSALQLASEKGNPAIVQLLVENGADINTDICGWTALLLAAKNGNISIVQYLVQKGAYLNAEDYHGRRTLHWTAKQDQRMTVQLLIDKGANSNAVDRWGRTALMWAVESRKLAVVKLLLEIGSDVELKTRDGSTALHLAAYVGEKEGVHLLLERGANIEARTQDNFTALHIAVLRGYQAVVRLLLDKGADVEAKTQWCGVEDDEDDYEDDEDDNDDDSDVYTSGEVYGSAKCLSKRLRQLLFEEGFVADVTAEARRSWTVRQLAARSGIVAMQRLLP